MASILESDMAVSAKTERILAFDLLRGFLLVVILIDHIELYPGLFDLFTGRGRLFVSAAEGFFFLSGLLVGMVYRRRLSRGLKFIFIKMWQRAFELYVASVISTLAYAYWAVFSNHPGIKYGLPRPINWGHLIDQTLLLRFGFGWADFLARFSILMIIAPLAFYLISRGWWRLMLMLSLVAWFFRGQNFTLAWQLLFNGGMLCGFYWREIQTRAARLSKKQKKYLTRGLYGLSLSTFAISYASVFLLSFINEHLSRLSAGVRAVILSIDSINDHVWLYAQKWTLGPLRIILFGLWFCALFLWIHKNQSAINHRSRGLLELLGRNSLYVYILHSVIVFLFWLFIPAHTNLLQNFVITLLALVLLVLGTFSYRLFRASYPGFGPGTLYGQLTRIRQSLIP